MRTHLLLADRSFDLDSEYKWGYQREMVIILFIYENYLKFRDEWPYHHLSTENHFDAILVFTEF